VGDGAPATSGIPRLAAVALGGAAGAWLRWGLDAWMAAAGAPAVDMPVATLLANLSGTFVLAVASRRLLGVSAWAVGVTVGLLGAFTTFSALVVEAVGLAGRPLLALGYVAASLAGGVVAALAGLRVGGRSS
jgi:CrcB protein